MRRALTIGLVLASAAAAAASAQEAGGVQVAPATVAGIAGLARPLEFTYPGVRAGDLQAGTAPADRRARHQGMVGRLRGDGGFLDGFAFGQPVAGSRARPLPPVGGAGGLAVLQPVVIDNGGGPVAIVTGNGNVIGQQVATTTGPVAQQQVTTVAGGSVVAGGNVNGAAAADEGGLEVGGHPVRRPPGAKRAPRRAE